MRLCVCKAGNRKCSKQVRWNGYYIVGNFMPNQCEEMSKRLMKQGLHHHPFNLGAYLTPVAHCPVWWTQNVSVTGNQGLGLQQMLAVCRWESLFIRAHGLDAQHWSLFLSIGSACCWAGFPLPCPPPAGRHGHVRRSPKVDVHSFNHWARK